MKQLVYSLFAVTLAASAGTICPMGNGTNPFPHNPDASGTGCNTVITVNSNLTVTTTVTDANPYEVSEDTLVGVVNNSTTPIIFLNLTGSNILGLDGDGICTYTFVGNGYCSTSQINGTDPQDYFGPTSTFTITTADSGMVHFSPAIAAGGSTYFSLENPPSGNLQVTVGGNTPEPGSVVLMGLGLGGLVVAFRRRSKLISR